MSGLGDGTSLEAYAILCMLVTFLTNCDAKVVLVLPFSVVSVRIRQKVLRLLFNTLHTHDAVDRQNQDT